MRILALDTTSALGSIVLLEDDRLIEELTMHSQDGFSHVLFDHLTGRLARHGWSLSNVDGFAAAAGPGSFTGVRVSLAAVKGLAEATGKPAIGVSNLQAGATFGTAAIRAPWIDARRGEIYGGLYSADLVALKPELVAPMEVWKAQLPPEAEIIACDGKPLAAAIARIARCRFLAGDRPDPASIDANYVRRSDAELFWKDAT